MSKPYNTMPPPSIEQTAQAMVDVLQDALAHGETVAWPRLGTFRVEHRSSQIEEQPSGEVVMHPPRDVVVFEPDTTPPS